MGFRFVNPHADTAFSKDPSGKKQARITDDAHLAYVRKLPSIISGLRGCEAAHIRYGDPAHRKAKTAKGRKPDDCYVVPLTPEEHRAQHAENEALWWAMQGIDPIDIALKLYQVTGDVEAGAEIVTKAQVRRALQSWTEGE